MTKITTTLLMLTLAAVPGFARTTPTRTYSPVFDRCMQESGGVTTSMRDCFGSEYQRLDAELNTRYRTLMTSMPKAKSQSLRVQQRAWLAKRKRVCDASGDEEAGGTLQLVMIDQCYLDSLYDRVAMFKAMQRR